MTSPSFVDVEIVTEDGFILSATRFNPPGEIKLRAAVVIACATGVHARLYRDLALWLSAHGVGACTFDYRYTGSSFPPPFENRTLSPEEHHAALLACPRDMNMIDTWGRKDFKAVIRYAAGLWPSVPLTVVGHSLGGHIMTLIPSERNRITRFICLNTTTAYRLNMTKGEEKRFTKAVIEPLETEGVLTTSRYGMGADLPYGCGKQWATWYFHPFFSLNNPSDRALMKSLNIPLLGIGFTDDPLPTKNAVGIKRAMMQHMSLLPSQPCSTSKVYSLWIDPRTAPRPRSESSPPQTSSKPWPPMGHVGAFHLSNPPETQTKQETIWMIMLDWILHEKVDAGVGEFTRWGVEDKNQWFNLTSEGEATVIIPEARL